MAKPIWSTLQPSEINSAFNKINEREYDRIRSFLKSRQGNWTANAAFDPVNKSRNRYTNVFPWDKNRVHLPIAKHIKTLDYINASYVTLSNDSKYIATQGPIESTIHHFWGMCFNEATKNKEKTAVVLMVTPLIEDNIVKCHRYWPDSIDPILDLSNLMLQDGIDLPMGLQVHYKDHEDYEEYTKTTIELVSGEEHRLVFHYYYHNWSDAKTPPRPDSLAKLLEELTNVKKQYHILTPIVHCSAGVGRTGTFIAMDYFLNHPSILTKNTSNDPIHEVFKKMRDDRLMMIQTVNQYLFIYNFFKHKLSLQ